MRTSDVVEHFGTQKAIADALGIKPPSVSDWGEFVPPLRQLQIEALTGGKLRADASILPAPSEIERAA
jgi:DNA-binding transcriptional regulator YdaS (Cro superfamily)